LYYSVKGPSSFGFSLFTYMAGLNHLDLVGDSREISHVSFWEGVPEPTGMTLAGGLLAAMALGRRRRMP
ncbi:MAG TPA: hypothetical protein PKC18_01060, partial [Lacipirellulaceae bacterium]|nr:hypothetical protein [Lacipirellulaceae bacterium]